MNVYSQLGLAVGIHSYISKTEETHTLLSDNCELICDGGYSCVNDDIHQVSDIPVRRAILRNHAKAAAQLFIKASL